MDASVRSRSAVLWYAGALVLVGFVLYANSLDASFHFDDHQHIERNRTIETFSRTWQAMVRSQRPLVKLTLAANYALGGRKVLGYHLVNIAIHVLAALVLMGLVRRTASAWKAARAAPPAERRPPQPDSVAGSAGAAAGASSADPALPAGPDAGAESSTPRANEAPARPGDLQEEAAWLGFAVALLWLAHPLQTQAVTYIIQRTESLMALFYLLTVYSVVRRAERPSGTGWSVAAVFFCVLGMASKEVMVTAPLVALLVDRTFFAGSFVAALRRRWGLYLALAGTWALALAIVGFKRLFEQEGTAGFGAQGVHVVAWWHYALSQPGVILHYLRLVIWPHPLCFDYGWPAATDALDVVLPTLAIGALLAGTVAALRRRSWLGVVGASFFLVLAPSSSVLPIADLAVEHRMYLALAPVVALLVIVLNAALEATAAAGWSRVFVVGLAALLGLVTIRRNQDYRTELRLWQTVVETAPDHYRGHNNLAKELLAQERWAEAVEHYKRALELHPGIAEGHRNLGQALMTIGRAALKEGRRPLYDQLLRRSIDQQRKALALKPDLAEAHADLAVALIDLAREDRRRGHKDEAARKRDEAIRHCREALRLQPRNALTHGTLGAALFTKGDRTQAIYHFRRALKLQPDYQAYQNLAYALEKTGQHLEARKYAAKADVLKRRLPAP